MYRYEEQIRARYEGLTPSFRKIADFVLEHPAEAALMTATQLARAMGVDAATIVRFAQYVGYTGYRQMVRELEDAVRARLGTLQTAVAEADSVEARVHALIGAEIQMLDVLRLERLDDLSRLFAMADAAPHIWLLGEGPAGYIARAFALNGAAHGLPVESVSDSDVELALALDEVAQDHLVLVLLYSQIDPRVVRFVELARQRGAKVAVISMSIVATAARTADLVVVCPHTEGQAGITLDVMSVIVQMLFGSLARNTAERAEAVSRALDDLRTGDS